MVSLVKTVGTIGRTLNASTVCSFVEVNLSRGLLYTLRFNIVLPIGGIPLTRLTWDGEFVSNGSRVLSPRVCIFTTWDRAVF